MAEARIGDILVQADELAHRVRELAGEISRDYEGRELLMIERDPSALLDRIRSFNPDVAVPKWIDREET